jgi:hypothetical protein
MNNATFQFAVMDNPFSPKAPVISVVGKTGNDNEKPCRFSNASNNNYPTVPNGLIERNIRRYDHSSREEEKF